MTNFYILTNNDSVDALFKQYQKMQNRPDVIYVEAAASRVLQMAREAIHSGSQLLSRPMTGVVPPGENPFLTLLMTVPEESGAVLHFESISLISQTMRAYVKTAKNRFRAYKDDMLKEFKTADMEQTLAVLQNLAELLSQQ